MLYMLDTNIISYILEGNINVREKLLKVLSGNTVVIPDIVYYEVQRGLYYNQSKQKQEHFDYFCNLFGVSYMNLNALHEAAFIYSYLRKDGMLIEDDDILIGANALENSAILVTNNERHFSRIIDLKIENWVIG